jgi:Asp-tRNA(Asn)/Glu-tRNA(Gln) amidotransferase A subunit family amidase
MSVFRETREIRMEADDVDGDPEQWRDAPIGLQITARRLEEEKVVDMLYDIRDALAAQE